MSIHVSKACKKVYLPQLPKSWYTPLWHPRRHLDDCNSLFYGIPKYQHDRFQRILHAAARIVCLLSKFSHITLVLCNRLPVLYRIQFEILLLVHRAIFGVAFVYLKKFLSFNESASYNLLRSNTTYELKVPKTKCKTFGDRAFARVGPSLWNILPSAIRSIRGVQGFKQARKPTHCISFHICPMSQSLYSDCGVVLSLTLSVLFVNMC